MGELEPAGVWYGPLDPQLSLFELAEEANKEHALCRQAGEAMITHAHRCGEALATAKTRIPHGEWLTWLQQHFDGSERTAQVYMRLSANPQTSADFDSIDACDRALRNDRNQSVTYKNQPAIDASNGAVPLEGTSHVYRVEKLLWPEAVEGLLAGLLIPESLHVCCGMSQLGDTRLDLDEAQNPDIVADAAAMPIPDDSFESVLCDPPYNGNMQWNHDLLSELSRVAAQRIVFQHWFIPANPDGRYKKAQDRFVLTNIFVWQPKTYFGRAQLISVFDRV